MFRCTVPMFLLVVGISGCHDGAPPTAVAPAEGTPLFSVGAESREATLQTVAQGIAAAMEDPAVRADVRDAMRASLLTQHRLVFHEYMTSPSAGRLVAAVARELGTDEAGVRTMVSQLPDLDFFVPLREDRRTWEATPNYAVTALLRLPKSRELTAYTDDGETIPVSYGVRHPGTAILQLSPPEFRNKRIAPQPAVPGSVIEDENDGTLSGTYTWTPTGGKPITVQLADLRSGRVRINAIEDCIDCSGGGSTAPSDTTFLDYMYIHYADGCGDPDPTFTANYYDGTGALAGTGELHYSEVPRHDHLYPHDPLIFQRIREGSTEKINVAVTDRDSGLCGGDDPKGNRDFFASDRAEIRTIYYNSDPTVNIELDWTPKF